MKNIIVLTGSPRAGSNTNQMAEAFIKGAQLMGHTVTKINTAELHVQGCVGCDCCYHDEVHPCCHDDDFNKIAPLIERADVVVFATPIYWYSFPATIKRVIDQFYCFYCGERDIKGKKAVLLSCGEDTAYNMFDGIQRAYELCLPVLGWTNGGMVLVPGVNKVGDIQNTDGLKRCEELGKTI